MRRRHSSFQSFLHNISDRGIRPGLSRMASALDLLGHPEHGRATVLVAGTNGKGSTAARIALALEALGRPTYLFTSPHLVRVEERYRFGGVPVATERLEAAHRTCLRRLPEGRSPAGLLTPFEWMTLVGFQLVAERETEVQVLEVGLGGRLDATNSADPDVAVISTVALDHMDRLGPTLEEIAAEKAGIMRPGRPGVVGVGAGRWIDPEGGWREGRDFRVEPAPAGGWVYSGPGGRVRVASAPGLGHGDPGSWGLALAAVEALGAGRGDALQPAAEAAARARWPGRFHPLRSRPLLLLDGAHNPAGSAWLVRALARAHPGARLQVLFGVGGKKDAAAMLRILDPVAERILLVRDREGRLRDPFEVCDLARAAGPRAPVVPEHRPAAEVIESLDGPILVTGSLHLVGEVLAELGSPGDLELLP